MNQKTLFFIVLVLVSNLFVYEVLHREIQKLGVTNVPVQPAKAQVSSLMVKLKEIKGDTLFATVEKSNIGYSPVSYTDATVTLTNATKIVTLEFPKSVGADTKNAPTKPFEPKTKELSLTEFKSLATPGMVLTLGSAEDMNKKNTFEATSIFFVK
ncbi:MAG: hypothetical protein HZA35_04315 [Parcubacteria group bacterium]|nr:hypothetical protein [Parcubacteria group bacterium]